MSGYDDRDGKIWMDGQLVEWRDANVHILTHALHYASSVFEGERLYDGKIFLSRKHSERLLKSGEMMDMPRHQRIAKIAKEEEDKKKGQENIAKSKDEQHSWLNTGPALCDGSIPPVTLGHLQAWGWPAHPHGTRGALGASGGARMAALKDAGSPLSTTRQKKLQEKT